MFRPKTIVSDIEIITDEHAVGVGTQVLYSSEIVYFFILEYGYGVQPQPLSQARLKLALDENQKVKLKFPLVVTW